MQFVKIREIVPPSLKKLYNKKTSSFYYPWKITFSFLKFLNVFKFFIQFWKVIFHLQLLQNIGSIPVLYNTAPSLSYTQ